VEDFDVALKTRWRDRQAYGHLRPPA
jgi:hypothetical protein